MAIILVEEVSFVAEDSSEVYGPRHEENLLSKKVFVALSSSVNSEKIISIFSLDLKALFFAVVGFVLNQLWAAYRARRIEVPWTAIFQRGNPEAALVTGAEVQVLVGGVACKNLYFCQIQLWNESSRDIEAIDLLFNFNQPFEILESQGGLVSSAKAAPFSEGFLNTINVVRALPEENRKKHRSYPYLLNNREFRLESINRGESAKFGFWINADDAKAIPVALVTTEKTGIRLVSRPANFRPFDVGTLNVALPIGLLLSFVSATFVAGFSLSPTILALTCVVIGAGTGVIGLAACALYKAIKRIV